MTTIELSTSIPIPTARPPSETILRVMPITNNSSNADSTDSGIVTEIIIDGLAFFRNRNITNTASAPPINILTSTFDTDSEMNSELSSVSAIVNGASCSDISAIMSLTARTTFVPFAPPAAKIETFTPCTPL